MDLIPLLDPGVQAGVKSEEEMLSEFEEIYESVWSHPDLSTTDWRADCGRILITTEGKYTVTCNGCSDRFDSMECFGIHLKTAHPDYGVQKDGWSKVPIKEEEPIKNHEIVDKVGTIDGIVTEVTVRRLSENSNSEKIAANVPKNIIIKKIPREMKLPRRKICSGNPRKRVKITADPIYDGKRLFCVTCDRQLPSKQAFTRHKNYHKGRLRKQRITHLNHGGQENASNETKVKDIGDYEGTIRNVHPTHLKCRFCHMQFAKPTERFQHEKSHPKEKKPYRCPLCPKSFTRTTEREIHESTHGEDRPYRCEQCPKSFRHKASCNRHFKEVHGGLNPGNVVSLQLEDTTKNGKLIRNKMVVFSESPNFDDEKNLCITCNLEFASSVSLSTHRLLHQSMILRKQATFSCELCSGRFKSGLELGEHIAMCHGEEVQKPLQDNPMNSQSESSHDRLEEPTECYLPEKHTEETADQPNRPGEPSHSGGKSFPSVGTIDGIVTEVTVRRLSENSNSEKIITNVPKNIITKKIPGEVKRPRYRICSGNPRKPVKITADPIYDGKRLFCVTCDRQLPSRLAFTRHKKYHRRRLRKQGITDLNHGGQEDASTKTKVKDELDIGDYEGTIRNVHPTYLKCRFCHMQFAKPTERFQHETSHPKEKKPYRCSLCPKSFTRNTERNIHESTHGEDRPYRCEQCPKSFRHKRSFNRHLKEVHGGLNPGNVVSLQLEDTTKNGKLIRNKMVVFSESPNFDDEKNLCITCNLEFASSVSLSTHKLLHQSMILRKQATFSCELCSGRFKSGLELEEHIAMCHGEEVQKPLQDNPMNSQSESSHDRLEETTECYLPEKHTQEAADQPNRPGEPSHSGGKSFPSADTIDRIVPEKTVCRLSENFNSKNTLTNISKNITTNKNREEVKIPRYRICSDNPRKPVKITADPIYDGKRLFCVTCDRQLPSRLAFTRHKSYHKERLRKQGITHLNDGGQEDVPNETKVKDELDIGDYEIQDSVYHGESVEKIHDGDRMKKDMDNLVDSHCNPSRVRCMNIKPENSMLTETDLTKESTNMVIVKSVFANPDEETLSEDINRQIETESEQRLNLDTKFNNSKSRDSLRDEPTDFQCRFCNKHFENLTERCLHEESHINEKAPYRCSICSKSFTRNFNRKNHELIHKGDRPFHCLDCGKTFPTKSYLKLHVQRSMAKGCELESSSAGISCKTRKLKANTSFGADVQSSSQREVAIDSSKESATKNDKTTFCEETSLQKKGIDEGRQVESMSKRRTVFTFEPKFDEERNFCITCDLQLGSQEAFINHKKKHRSSIRKWKIRNGLR
ncbi:zinc finger protein 160-like isoform X3 [Hermetia illucens]|uniref:zinc finger protein 160-like isoform X3 n=1 Tax=Hermetia illucens TaxID=343691 RepID=UPI0018CC75B7|nr:zinc finger protein 160-like isoform X3 [Hermetia illucens]